VPKGDPDAREQFARAEGLAHVIVGAGIERGDLVPLLAAGGEDDDRHCRPFAQPADHREAVHVRQAEVDDDDLRLARGGFDEARGAGLGLEETVALTGEGGAQKAADLGLVLDEDDDGLRHRRAPAAAGSPRAAA
jgi:hypothetical protein